MDEARAYWPLQDAKARFSELANRRAEEGPQTVTMHGEPAVLAWLDVGTMQTWGKLSARLKKAGNSEPLMDSLAAARGVRQRTKTAPEGAGLRSPQRVRALSP